MKRAQIEEARRRAKELLEEEERQKLEWKPPDENDFSVHAHLLRKKLKAMHEPLGETAKHANFIVREEKLVIWPKLKHKLVIQELIDATIVHDGTRPKMSFRHFKSWLLEKKPTNSFMFVQTMFSLIAVKKSLQRKMKKRQEILDSLNKTRNRRQQCRKVVESEGYPFLKQVLCSDLEEKKLKLKIKTSNKQKHIVDMNSTDSVKKLKKLLQKIDGIPSLSSIHIIFEGSIIDYDDLSLSECGIVNKSSIDVVYITFPIVKRLSKPMQEMTEEVMRSLDDDIDEFSSNEEILEEVAYLRDFLHQMNNAVHHINVAKFQAKHKRKLRDNSRNKKKKRVLHNKKGRRSDFLHGYEIVVDPAVLVRVATTEHDRASAIYEDTYQNLMSIETKIRNDFIVCIQRNWRFKLWIRKSSKRMAWIKGQEGRIKQSLLGYDDRKLKQRQKAAERSKQLTWIRERKAATLMQRRFKQFMIRKYPPNGRPWKEPRGHPEDPPDARRPPPRRGHCRMARPLPLADPGAAEHRRPDCGALGA